MHRELQQIRDFVENSDRVARIEVEQARGSTPRDNGTWMLVSKDAACRTIGGGYLEYMAIDKARQILASPQADQVNLQIPLGPEIGQCCGGFVALRIEVLDKPQLERQLHRVKAEFDALPRVYVFGAGHVGRALSRFLALLPVHGIVVDTRESELSGLPSDMELCHTAMPEALVRDAPPASAFVIMTHDHALDFLIAREALGRGDAAYVGMIGSKTKRATFRNWLLREDGSDNHFSGLTCPVGNTTNADKRPEVIAAATAAQIMQELGRPSQDGIRNGTLSHTNDRLGEKA